MHHHLCADDYQFDHVWLVHLIAALWTLSA